MILQSGLMDRNMQVEFDLKVLLKSWDVDIYGNVKEISLTQTVSEIWFFLFGTSSIPSLLNYRKDVWNEIKNHISGTV